MIPVTRPSAPRAIEHRVGFLVRLGTHDVGHPEPLLAMVFGLDHPQHEHRCADP